MQMNRTTPVCHVLACSCSAGLVKLNEVRTFSVRYSSQLCSESLVMLCWPPETTI